MDKKALRAEIKAKKRAMTEEQIAATSEALARQFYAHPAYQNAKSIFGYLSYNQEVRPMPMLEQAQDEAVSGHFHGLTAGAGSFEQLFQQEVAQGHQAESDGHQKNVEDILHQPTTSWDRT